MKRSTLIFLSALLFPLGCSAADANGKYRNFSPQNFDSCGEFIGTIDDCKQGRCSKLRLFKVWSAGYLTSYNSFTPDTYDIAGGREADTTDESTLLWLEDYCRQHPSTTYAEALKRLTIALYPTRIKVAPQE